ncbi:hypothetical protein BP00DRAFT_171176 [Aspergillus indologenus CBS 114.80]|uniref:Uncharacterized protein n=1 Tax=Aspergillus indologenus CBS 114.80 TaxID=1450541 RepID=A0A2V5IIU9_9EURO|nr:hypothetical protein BP00DRAFT_171176 [Aspergillus indologenus CBS 114.80]
MCAFASNCWFLWPLGRFIYMFCSFPGCFFLIQQGFTRASLYSLLKACIKHSAVNNHKPCSGPLNIVLFLKCTNLSTLQDHLVNQIRSSD